LSRGFASVNTAASAGTASAAAAPQRPSKRIFMLPGVTNFGTMIAGDLKIIWRLVFIHASAFVIIAMMLLPR
jgi:hypothetical protein